MGAEASYIFDRRYDFQHFSGTANAYVICSIPRAGGHYLCHLLWSTGSFGSPSEYFLGSFVDAWKKHYGTATELDSIRRIVADRTSPNGWFGIKVHWNQFQRLQSLSVPESIFRIEGYVFLTRKDIVAQAISRVIAHQTGQWISLDPKLPREPVYDRGLIAKYIDLIERDTENWRLFRERIDKPFVELTYEDLLGRPQTWVDDIARTLGVSGQTAIASLPVTKQGDERNREWARRFLAGD